jgi:hypothetical protein
MPALNWRSVRVCPRRQEKSTALASDVAMPSESDLAVTSSRRCSSWRPLALSCTERNGVQGFGVCGFVGLWLSGFVGLGLWGLGSRVCGLKLQGFHSSNVSLVDTPGEDASGICDHQ